MKNANLAGWWWLRAFNLSTWGAEARGFLEFKANLVYLACSFQDRFQSDIEKPCFGGNAILARHAGAGEAEASLVCLSSGHSVVHSETTFQRNKTKNDNLGPVGCLII